MKRPTMKQEVAIINALSTVRIISMNATADAVSDLGRFGKVIAFWDCYRLYVDARYDFQEVVKYIKNYN